LAIGTYENRMESSPGDRVSGKVFWELDEEPGEIEVRLFWYTEGKGSQDVCIVDSIVFDSPAMQETREFNFDLPNQPYGFSGVLISLLWAIEVVVPDTGDTERVELVVGPGDCEVVLGRCDE